MDFYTYIAKQYVIPYYIHFLKAEMACTLLEKGGRLDERVMLEFDQKIRQLVNDDELCKADDIYLKMSQRLRQKQKDIQASQLTLFKEERRLAYSKLFKFLSVFDKIHTLHSIVPTLCPFDTNLSKLKEVCLSRIERIKKDYAPHHKQIAKVDSYGFPFLGHQLNIDIKHFTLRLENVFDIVLMQRFVVKPTSNAHFPSITLLQGLVLTIDTPSKNRAQSEGFDEKSIRREFATCFNWFIESWRMKHSQLFSDAFTLSGYENTRKENEKYTLLSYPMISALKLMECSNFPTLLTDCANTWLCNEEKDNSAKLEDYVSRWSFLPENENWDSSIDVDIDMRLLPFDLIIEGVEITENSNEDEWLRSHQMLLVNYLKNLDFDFFYQDIALGASRLNGIEIKYKEPFKAFLGWIIMMEGKRLNKLHPPKIDASATEQEKKKEESLSLQEKMNSVFQRYSHCSTNLFDIVRELFLFQEGDFTKSKSLLFTHIPHDKRVFCGFRELLTEGINMLVAKPVYGLGTFLDAISLPTADFNLKRIRLALECLESFKLHFEGLSNTQDRQDKKEKLMIEEFKLNVNYNDVIGLESKEKSLDLNEQLRKITSNAMSFLKQGGNALDFDNKESAQSQGQSGEANNNEVKLYPVVLFGLRFNGHFFQSSIKELVVELNQSRELLTSLEIFYMMDILTEEQLKAVYQMGITNEVLNSAYQAFHFQIEQSDNYDLLNEWSVLKHIFEAYIQKNTLFINFELQAKSFVKALEGRQEGESRKHFIMQETLFLEMAFI